MRPHRPSGPALTGDLADAIMLAAVTVAAVVTTGSWLTGQLAALLFHGAWPPVSIGQALGAAWLLPGHLGDPRQAWPASARPDLPGPFGFLVAGILSWVITAAVAVAAGRHALRNRPARGFASRAAASDALSEQAVRAKAAVVRPSLADGKCEVTDAGVRIGRAIPSGTRLACSAEDSVAVGPHPGRASPRRSSSRGCARGPGPRSAPRSGPTSCSPPPCPGASWDRSR
jgi:hypothetical protein